MARNIAYGHDHRFTDCGIQTGSVNVTPTANAVTTVSVTFPEAFAEIPDIVLVSPVTTVPYTAVRYASASGYTTTGFKLHLYRTGTGETTVTWMAVGKMK
jgi:hypothetical protein